MNQTTPNQWSRLITAKAADKPHRRPLTDIQSKVLAFAVTFLQVNDTFPTCRAVAAAFGFRVHNTAHGHLTLLERKGYLERNEIGTLMLTDRPSATSGVCGWELDDEDSGTWRSACGELWSFVEGGPLENRVSYCHHCGGRVHLIKTPEEVAHG